MKEKILWLTRTALLIALLIGLQAATAPLGITLLTGSLVNLVLVVSVILSGLYSGLCVALLSPLFAILLGVGPLQWPLIPFIMLGNLSLVLVWHFVGNLKLFHPAAAWIAAAIPAAGVKFGVLYVGVVKIAVPLILKLPAPQAEKISTMFSLPQLLTALIGGGIAIALLPLLLKAVNRGDGTQRNAA